MDKKLWWRDEEQLEKLANSGLPVEFIEALIKEAAKQKEKQEVMDDFDAAGRIMAHAYYDELCKVAESKLEPAQVEDSKVSALRTILNRG